MKRTASKGAGKSNGKGKGKAKGKAKDDGLPKFDVRRAFPSLENHKLETPPK